jgi:SAM-dependent methyltransferase
MDNVRKTYSEFHRSKYGGHIYPTEWVIRTLLGKYRNLNLDKSKYKDANILDLGFGDCRNMPLLSNCEFKIHGIEISDDIISLGRSRLSFLNIAAELRKGTNVDIPFEDEYFDYVLACHSCYYVDEGHSFNENLVEISRTLKSGGIFIASLPAPDNFILQDCIRLPDGHVKITNDIFNLRNGYIFRTFEDESEIHEVFGIHLNNIVVCKCLDNFWGLQINFFIIVGEKK